MKIDTTFLIPIAALVCSVVLLLAGKQRVFEVIALIASGVWLALELDLFNWPLHHRLASPGLLIGGGLLVSGVIVYLNTDNKREVTASTVIAILGGILVHGAVNGLR
jgi:hypothetical protein